MEKENGLYKNECWIETYTGKFVNPLKLKSEDIDIKDIAHALSLTCRFNGHCKEFYSVGEHSIRVSGLLKGLDNQLTGLLHDATEAYMADIARPVKWALPDIRNIEGIIRIAINEKYDLKGDWIAIKQVDDILLASEARDLMFTKGKEWYFNENTKPLDYKIVPMGSWNAEANFLRIFDLLTSEIEKRKQSVLTL
jgi:5'-deoxynucleotidase YfbR-like HD superfamily hydrolase